MKLPAREPHEEPILVDRAADYFGSPGRVYALRAALRTDGSLALTEDRLIFTEHETGTTVEIPLTEIRNIGMGRWHEPTGTFLPVLKITYRENLILGIHISRPDRWARAFEDLVARGRLPGLREGPKRSRTVPRGFRLLVAGMLVLALVLGALPQAISRLASRSSARLAGSPAPTRTVP